MKLSIVILNYNTQDHLLNCLKSLTKTNPIPSKEIIVVDNASSDNSVALVKQKFPLIKLIVSSKNLGFAGGNNLGIKQTRGEYILLLNSDTEVPKNTFKIMIDYMDQHQDVGASTCIVELTSGKIDPASHRGFPTPWASFTFFSGLEKLFPRSKLFGQYHQGWKNMAQVHEIDSPVGAFFLTRKKVVDQVGLLDEAFFIYAEDIDWAIRIKKHGWKIMYVPFTKIAHVKKVSGRSKKVKGKITSTAKKIRTKTSYHFFETMKQFYDKHYRRKYPELVRIIMFLGIWFVRKIKK